MRHGACTLKRNTTRAIRSRHIEKELEHDCQAQPTAFPTVPRLPVEGQLLQWALRQTAPKRSVLQGVRRARQQLRPYQKSTQS